MAFPVAAKPLTETERRALELIKSNPVLTETGHALLNAGVPGLLRMGLIEHAPGWRIAYRLTGAGKVS